MKHVDFRSMVIALAALALLPVKGLEAQGSGRPVGGWALAAAASREPVTIDGQIKALQAEIKALQDSIKALQTQLKGAAEELDRARRAKPQAPKPGATQEEKDKYNHQLTAWQARVDAATKKVETLKSDIEGKRAQLLAKQMQLKKLQDAKAGRKPGPAA